MARFKFLALRVGENRAAFHKRSTSRRAGPAVVRAQPLLTVESWRGELDEFDPDAIFHFKDGSHTGFVVLVRVDARLDRREIAERRLEYGKLTL